ncbi:MAG: ABC transporter permease [Planctomycetaceae bacterium]|nr:ABC transporter permease [Planctomycetaceae bacterium]
MASLRDWPVWQLTLARLKLFIREPAAIFWVYGFPILMMMSLGIAFRDNPVEVIAVDLVEGVEVQGPRSKVKGQSDIARNQGSGFGVQGSGNGDAGSANRQTKIQTLKAILDTDPRFKVNVSPAENWRKRLQSGKTDLVIEVNPDGSQMDLQFWDEPRRAESRLARYAVESFLFRNPNPSSPPPEVKHLEEPGSRYIDFLLPGMMGMGLMGGGMWGVGFVVVDMRVRKLLKRFLATPMRRSDFLIAIIFSRLIFTLADILILLLFGYLAFGIRSQGSYLDLTAVVLLGGAAFAGIGLLVASRVQTIETVSGLMNLVMLPMWILSGVFFSSERFPEAVQPVINLLPLTALNQALRGIMLEGKSLAALWPQLAILAAYASITFTIALRIFRWR